MHGLLPFLALLAAGCACEHGIGLNGEQDADAEAEMSWDSWDPPIESMGEPGWRDSAEPWCGEAPIRLDAADVWSDPSSVYVLARFFYSEGGACPSETCYGVDAIFRNDGTGWSRFWEEEINYFYGTSSIWGIPGGPILTMSNGYGCMFRAITDGEASCVPDVTGVSDVFVVNESLAYAIMGDRVIYYDGSTWGPVPAAYVPYVVEHIWADEESVFCSGPEGTIISLEDGDWRIHDTRTLVGIRAIWGFGGSDVWAAGGETGLMHWDGLEWIQVEWPGPHAGGMWGADESHTLFVYGQESSLVMRDDTGFHVLLDVSSIPGMNINAVWGNSATEVFIAVTDYYHERTGCGVDYLLWWDGTSFHWF